MSKTKLEYLSDLADSAMKDPIVLEKICEQVVKTIREDLRHQRDRVGYSQRVN